MIKVCMLTHSEYYRDGRVRRYAEALAKAGVHVDVLALRCKASAHDAAREGITVFQIPLRRGYRGRFGYVIEYALALFLFTIWQMRLQTKNHYHLIHVHNMPDFLVIAALIPRLWGVKLILDIHDPMPEFYMAKFKARAGSIVVKALRWQERLSAWPAHAIITANANFKKNLVARGLPAHKITIVNNIADTKIFNRDKFKSAHSNGYFTLIYPGTFAPRYGLDVAIRALPKLVSSIPNIRLLIIGPEVEFTKELIQLAEQLGVAEFVEFKPAIPIDEVPEQLRRADVGLYLALPDPHMDIATPTKVLEYAVMGIPVIASRLKILESLFSDSALMFFQPGDVDEFAHAVLRLHGDPAKRDELVEAADEIFVRRHSWHHEREQYFNLLNHVLDLRRPLAAACETRETLVKQPTPVG